MDKKLEFARDQALAMPEPDLNEAQRVVLRMVAARMQRQAGLPHSEQSVTINRLLTRAMRIGYALAQELPPMSPVVRAA
jgi:hypothetical protein